MTALAAASSGQAHAAGISTAGGKEDVMVQGSTAPAATSSTCATASVGNVNGGAADFTTVFQPVAPNNNCTNTFFDKNGRPVAKFGGIGKIGPSAVPKFPAGGASSLGVTMTVGGGAAPDRTVAQGRAGFISSVTPITIPFTNIVISTIYDSVLTVGATVTKPTALAPIGAASGVSLDPWFFTPTSSDTLSITVTLSDIQLDVATSGADTGFAEVQASGSFLQVDPSDPSIVLATLGTWNDVFADDGGSVTPATQIELSGNFAVTPGNMYELTADLGAFAEVPEPGSAALLAAGLAGLVLRRRPAALAGRAD